MNRLASLISTAALLTAATVAPAHSETRSGTHAPDRLVLAFSAAEPRGVIMVALFDSQAAYEDGGPVRQARVDVAAGEQAATFDDLPAGEYAAKVFHDLNGDGRMNANPFGMPIEPYAFSNNAVGNMGPARWEQARFTVSGDTAQTISFR